MRALSLVFLFLIPFTLKAQLQKSLIGKSAPKVVFSSSLQAEIPSNFYKNKVLVLDFWATWCAPCIANFPHFNALASKFEKKGVVFCLSQARDASKVIQTHKEAHGLIPNSIVPVQYGN